MRLGAVALVAFAFVQAPGRVVGDTKADLVIDPAHFLGRALQAWNGGQGFGQLGNQTYGYLFPMGPFFLVGHEVGLPGWWTQRLWWVLLLLVGYYGTHRLAAALGSGTPGARLAGALAYALAPRVLTVLGGISVGGMARCARAVGVAAARPRRAGRLTPRRAAALSGAAALAMGGGERRRHRGRAGRAGVLPARGPGPAVGRRLLGWWLLGHRAGLGLVAGPAAHPGPLRLPVPRLHRERAHHDVDHRRVRHAARRRALGRLPAQRRPRAGPPGSRCPTSCSAMLRTCLLAAAGWPVCAGATCPTRPLADVRRGRPVVICAGHAGRLGGAAAAGRRHAARRRAGARCATCTSSTRCCGCRWRSGWPHCSAGCSPPTARRCGATGPGAGGGCGCGGCPRPPGWRRRRCCSRWRARCCRACSRAWRRRARTGRARLLVAGGGLAARARVSGSALLVPSSNFAVYRWGSPQDEPLQALARSAWAVRDAVPLGAPGSYRILDGSTRCSPRAGPAR